MSPPLRLWRITLLTLTLALAAGASLAAAIGAGWNNPRPIAPPTNHQAGPLLFQVTQSETQAVYPLDNAGETFVFEAIALPPSVTPASYGLILNRRDDRYTVFAVDTNGYMAVLQVAGDQKFSLVDWQQFPHIHRGQATNQLRLACSHRSCQGWINDEHAVVFDRGDERGSIGLWGHCLPGENARFAFQDISFWKE